jgi:hypothetical protein
MGWSADGAGASWAWVISNLHEWSTRYLINANSSEPEFLHEDLIQGCEKERMSAIYWQNVERVTQSRRCALASAPTPHQNAEPLTLMLSMEEYLKDALT